MSWALTGVACIAITSSYLTVYLLSDSEPYINEDGEEEYSLSSYVKYGVAYVIKCTVKKVLESIGFQPEMNYVRKNDNVIHFNPQPRPRFEDDDDNDNELVV